MPTTKVLTIRGGPMDGEPIDATNLTPGCWVWVPYHPAWWYHHDADIRIAVNKHCIRSDHKAWSWYDGLTLTWHPEKA